MKHWKQWQTLFFWAPKLLQMVTAAMKLKDTLQKESYDQPRQHIKSRDITLPTKVHLLKAMVLNMLSRLVITFLPRSKHLLISWLQSPSAVILEPRKVKSDTVSTVSPSISHEVKGPDAMIFIF